MVEKFNSDSADPEALWGLYDTEDDVWMGDDYGPKRFSDYGIARIAAQVLDEQLKQTPGRTRAKEYDFGPKRLREKVETKMSPLKALMRLEGGKVQ